MVTMPPGFTINSSANTSAQLNSADPGQVFTFKGNDFLSPNTVSGNIDTFSSGANATPDMFGKNPDSTDILNITRNFANNVFNSTFGVTNLANMPGMINGGITATNGTLPAGTTTTGGVVVGQVVSTPSPQLLSDLQNFNPLMWLNPSASNVTLGTMDSFNKLMGGNGIFTPSTFPNNPLYPYIAPLQPSFSEVSVPTFGGTVNNLPQALIFPNTAQSGANLWNTALVPTAVIPVNTTTGGTTTTGTTGTTQTTITAMLGIFALFLAKVTRNA